MFEDLKKINSLDKSIFLSEKTLSFLKGNLRKSIPDKEIDLLLESYISFIQSISDLYAHGTGSYALKEIIKSGYILSSPNILTGEGATDMIISPRVSPSFSRIDSLHNLFMTVSFSFPYEKRKKLFKEMYFTADREFPHTLLKDIAYLQRELYPDIVRGRVKKMLKMDSVPEKVSKEEIDKAYNLWIDISGEKDFFRSKKVEKLSKKAFESIRKSFLNNIYPIVSFDGIKTGSITEISKGLNLCTPNNFEEAKYHLLRAIYISLIRQGVFKEEEINDQEKYKEHISKEVLKLLSYDSPYYLKILDPRKNAKLLKELGNQYPVLICFTLPKDSQDEIFNNAVTHMSYELRIRESIPAKYFKYILVPYKRMEETNLLINNKDIKIIPFEIVEMIRCVLHKYMPV